MDTLWLSYRELAERLGINPESARTLAKRRKWPRKPANDGTVRLGIPSEYFGARSPERAPDHPDDRAPEHIGGHSGERPPEQAPERPDNRTPECPPDNGADHDEDAATGMVALLQARVGELQAELSQARAKIDVLQDKLMEQTAKVAATDVRLAEVRARLLATQEERDRWHTLATARRRWWPFQRSA
jgi:hypothetical protein